MIGPNLWAKSVLNRYKKERKDFPGTGGELAKHLVDKLGLSGVSVVETEIGDHYNPLEKTVCLQKSNFREKSLTAIATATHEVGHAIQDHYNYQPLKLRTAWVQKFSKFEKIGSFMIILSPILTLLHRVPGLGLINLIGGILILGSPALIHLITLPVELDASFQKALPLLQKGEYIPQKDLPHVRKILMACALTYIAGSLISMLNFGRWLAVIRR